MTTHPVTFPGSRGSALAARLDVPDGSPIAWAIFAHCFTCSKESKAAAFIARALAVRGFGVLRFDFTGLGESEGDFAETDFSSNVADLQAAAAWLEAQHGPPELLIGHSLGGAAVLAAASAIAACRAVVTIGAPFDPAHVARHFREQLERIAAEGQATVSLAGRPFTITQDFVDDLAAQTPATRIGALACALLVMHAPDDRVVGVAQAKAIFEAARHSRSFISLDGADHLLTRKADAHYAAAMIATWASRYLPGS